MDCCLLILISLLYLIFRLQFNLSIFEHKHDVFKNFEFYRNNKKICVDPIEMFYTKNNIFILFLYVDYKNRLNVMVI